MTTWKEANREYYLLQKRVLSSRPAYKAHRREMYRQKRTALISQDVYIKPIRGRPKKYSTQEAVARKRESAAEWARSNRRINKISTGNK